MTDTDGKVSIRQSAWWQSVHSDIRCFLGTCPLFIYESNSYWCALEFYSVANIFKMFKKLQSIANFLFGWIAEAVKVSVLQGQGSRWNFGSYFGLTFEEFLGRIHPIVHGNPYWNALSGFVQNYDAVTARKGTLTFRSKFFC